MVNTALTALEREIESIQPKSAYEEALTLNRTYVQSNKFRLMFLRADNFNVRKAAARLVLFMEKKKHYFGVNSLVRSLTHEDLTSDDIDTLKFGPIQILPSRDQSGRMVVVDFSTTGPKLYKSELAVFRSYLYLILNALEDEDTQIRGVVFLLWYYGPLRVAREDMDPELTQDAIQSDRWVPLRVMGIHFCLDPSPIKSILIRLYQALSPLGTRHIMRHHDGMPTEVMYHLMSFGIPVDLIPVDSQGKAKTNNHRKWISKQQVKEKECHGEGLEWNKIDMPTHRDVLVGKGKPFQNFPGTVFMRHLIGKYSMEYMKATSNLDKWKVRKDVIEAILESGGRFLKKDDGCPGWWVEASDKEVHDKIQKAFAAQGATRRPVYLDNSRLPSVSPLLPPDFQSKRARLGLHPKENYNGSSCC